MAKKGKRIKLTAKEASYRKRLLTVEKILKGIDEGKWTREAAVAVLASLIAFEKRAPQ